MALSSRRVGLIVALTALALGGLMWLQVSLLRYAMEIKEQTFHDNVMSVLGRISQSLTTGEVATLAAGIDGTRFRDGEVRVMAFVSTGGQTAGRDWTDSTPGAADAEQGPLRFDEHHVYYEVLAPQHIRLSVLSATDDERTVLVDSFHQAGEYALDIEADQFDDGTFIWKYTAGSGEQMVQIRSHQRDTSILVTDTAKSRLARDMVDRLMAAEFTPVEARLDSINVDSVIGAEMILSGIDMEYVYGVLTRRDDSLRLARPAGFEDQLRASDYRVRLFPHDFLAEPSYLMLHFPDQQSYIWAQILPMAGAELIFMLIIVLCFGYTIMTILRQRRFARSLVDFINNMTHEFKTPISTVALATEAIRRPDVLSQSDRVLHFNEMITTEIGRMRTQTEKILQMAALEEGDIALSLSEVDLHDVINQTADAVALQVEARGGHLHRNLGAMRPTVEADVMHLTNIVSNLLDNAIKYSPNAPEITISTADADGGIRISVEDRGMGMRVEDQKQAFDKYFRVPTGNRHDVKGFGLGLSYVQLMVQAHGGRVTLTSQPGQGTRVEFFIPYSPPDGYGK